MNNRGDAIGASIEITPQELQDYPEVETRLCQTTWRRRNEPGYDAHFLINSCGNVATHWACCTDSANTLFAVCAECAATVLSLKYTDPKSLPRYRSLGEPLWIVQPFEVAPHAIKSPHEMAVECAYLRHELDQAIRHKLAECNLKLIEAMRANAAEKDAAEQRRIKEAEKIILIAEIEKNTRFRWRPISEIHEDLGPCVLININDPGDLSIGNNLDLDWDESRWTHFHQMALLSHAEAEGLKRAMGAAQ